MTLETLKNDHKLVPYQSAHVMNMGQMMSPGQVGHEYLAKTSKFFEASVEGWTFMINGQPSASGGFIPCWKGVYTVWLFSCATNKAPLQLIRVMNGILLRFCSVRFWRRIECTVRVDIPNGARLVEIMGFKLDGYAEKYNPDGVDSYRYSLINESEGEI